MALAAVDGINVGLPLVVRYAIDSLTVKDQNAVWIAAGMYLLLMILQAGGRYLWRIYLIGTSHTIAKDLRIELYSHFQNLPLRYYQKVRTGDLMSRTTNDVESVRMGVGPGILVATDALFLFLMIIPVMFYLSWKLALITFAFYPFVPWLTSVLGNRIDALFTKLQEKMSELSAYAQESFQGIRWIKSFVLEQRVSDRFRELSEDYRREGNRLAKYEAVFSPTLALLTDLGTLLILIIGGHDVITGALTVGTFVAFQRFVVQLAWPMEAIGWAVTMHREGIAAIRRIDSVLSVPLVESIYPHIETTLSSRPDGLSIGELKFQYEGSRQGIELSNLSIPPGKKIGIVGPVGSGKSTLFHLMLRLYEPEPGTLFYGGRDVREIPLSELRRKIGSVEQHVFLFSESIATNVSLGMKGPVDRQKIEDLCKVVLIDEEIRSLDRGYETPLGERGINLSGGQKQRIALARALYRKPELLLLDDCFSAVDREVEHQIIRNLLKGFRNLSFCIATHRLAIMPFLDEVWVLDHGKLVAKGVHSDVKRSCSLYEDLWEKSERHEEAAVVEEGTCPQLL